MTNPEETEREALIAALRRPRIPASGAYWKLDRDAAAVLANFLIGDGYSRLSERTVTEAYHDGVVSVAQRKIHELEGVIERLRLSESETPREWGVLNATGVVDEFADEETARRYERFHRTELGHAASLVSRHPAGEWMKEGDQ